MYVARKNDILQFLVKDINEEFIMGSAGPVQVFVPRSKIPEKNSNYYKGELYLEN